MPECERCGGDGVVIVAGAQPCPLCQANPGLALPAEVARVVEAARKSLDDFRAKQKQAEESPRAGWSYKAKQRLDTLNDIETVLQPLRDALDALEAPHAS
jgi:hypothetical protein